MPPERLPLQLSVPSPTCTEPVGVPASDVTLNWTVNACPACDGSGESAVIVVTVGAAASTICVLDTEAKPVAENLSVRVPGEPLSTRSVNVARPFPSVG